jgi:hypothetical protein
MALNISIDRSLSRVSSLTLSLIFNYKYHTTHTHTHNSPTNKQTNTQLTNKQTHNSPTNKHPHIRTHTHTHTPHANKQPQHTQNANTHPHTHTPTHTCLVDASSVEENAEGGEHVNSWWIDLLGRWDRILPALSQFHLAIFFVVGIYYQLSKRAFAIRYVCVVSFPYPRGLISVEREREHVARARACVCVHTMRRRAGKDRQAACGATARAVELTQAHPLHSLSGRRSSRESPVRPVFTTVCSAGCSSFRCRCRR